MFQNGQAILTGTFPATSDVALALGGRALRPEKATNFSGGVVIRVGGLDVTVDGYLINLRDQLVISENIQASSAPNSTVAADVTRTLAPYSVTAAPFFINGVRSQAKGIDLVAHYRLNTSAAGTFDLTAAGNVNKIELKRVPSRPQF